LKPTTFPSVPRLFNKLYGKISAGVEKATGLKGWLVRTAIQTKLENCANGQGLDHYLYDKLVFNKMKAILGGNVKRMATGSAPISAEVLNFLKVCFCCTIVEGYGMTETTGGACGTFMSDNTSGHVGGPL